MRLILLKSIYFPPLFLNVAHDATGYSVESKVIVSLG